MSNLVFDWSAIGNMVIGALILYAGKLAWQRYGSKSARVTPEGCSLRQEACRAKMLAEWYTFKTAINSQTVSYENRMKSGDDSFTRLNDRVDRTNILLEAMITIQLEMCHSTPVIDCEDLTRLLIKQGINVEGLKLRAKND